MKPPKASTPTAKMRVPRGGPRVGAGRNRLFDEPMTSVSTSLPASALDKLIQVANAQDVSVAEAQRTAVFLYLNIVNVNVIQNR